MSADERAAEADFGAIERLLRCAYPKKDTAALVRRLQQCFITPGAVFSASPYLLESCGVNTLLTTEHKRHDGPTLVVQIAASDAATTT